MSKKRQIQYYEELAKKSIQKKISPRFSMGRSATNQIRKMKKISELGQFKSEDLILDLGCGECLELIALKGKRIETIAVDLSSELLKIAINLIKIYDLKTSFVRADAEYLPFKSKVFNHSFCIALLHHILNPSKAIEEMKRVTRKQGHIVIMESNLLNPACWIQTLRHWSLEKGIFRVTQKKLIKILKRSDLKNLTIDIIISKPDKDHHYFLSLLKGILEILQRSKRARKVISPAYIISSELE